MKKAKPMKRGPSQSNRMYIQIFTDTHITIATNCLFEFWQVIQANFLFFFNLRSKSI